MALVIYFVGGFFFPVNKCGNPAMCLSKNSMPPHLFHYPIPEEKKAKNKEETFCFKISETEDKPTEYSYCSIL